MAEVKTLTPPKALYDFLLFNECASKDWTDGKGSQKYNIKGDGSLMNYIKWDITPSCHPNDSGGNTKLGVTAKSWRSYVNKHPEKGYNANLTSMTKQGWLDFIDSYWEGSCAGKAANYACAFNLFDMMWLGFGGMNSVLKVLKENADIKDYKFKEVKNGKPGYSHLADATHAYTDPMVAYSYLRKSRSSYLYNVSPSNSKNYGFRCGWLKRSVLVLTLNGLYVPTSASFKSENLSETSTLDKWENVALKWVNENKAGYVKIFDWGASPESIEKITASSYDLTTYGTGTSGDYSGGSTGGYSGDSTGGAYSGCSGVYQLGNYSNTADMVIEPKQNQSREEVLNTLVSNSYTPDKVKKCSELITVDKKKGIKTKSES